MSDVIIALVLGGALGSGLWSLVAALPRFAAPRLITRVAPYVRDVTDPVGRTPRMRTALDPASGLAAGLRAVWGNVRRRFGAVLGGATDLEHRFVRAGWHVGVEEFRGRQLAAALIAGAFGALCAVFASSRGVTGPLLVLLPLLAALAAVVGADIVLSRAVKKRRRRVEDELPVTLDFLALCLSAGEALPDAVARAGEIGQGALAGELRRVSQGVRTGVPFATALREASDRLGVPAVTRAVDQIVSAVERGAPIAAVLRDQASDAHDEERRRLLEAAGTKEVTMLLPLVFLILPLSVLMAAYPGFVMLQEGFR